MNIFLLLLHPGDLGWSGFAFVLLMLLVGAIMFLAAAGGAVFFVYRFSTWLLDLFFKPASKNKINAADD